MKRFFGVLMVLAVAVSGANAGYDFSLVDNWVGSGSNQAALVIDWNTGEATEAKVWGFRWDGELSVVDMALAVVAADDSLYAIADFGTSMGDSIGGFGYDDGDGVFGITRDEVTYDQDAFAVANGTIETDNYDFNGWVDIDSEDMTAFGWYDGFWELYNAIDGGWAASNVGASSVMLTDGAWAGFSWAPGFVGTTPSIPEPATVLLLGLGGMFFRKRKS